MKKIIYFSNMANPYRTDYFNELGKYVDLTVIYSQKCGSNRDNSWNKIDNKNFKFQYIFSKDARILFFLKKAVKNIFKNKFDAIVITTFMSANGLALMSYLKKKKIKFFIESDGGFANFKENIFKRMLKRYALKGAEAYFSTADVHDEYYTHYGVDKQKIVRYHFTSIFKKDVLSKSDILQKKGIYKKEMNIKDKKIVLSIGQFIHRKGFDLLIKSIPFVNEDIYFIIIGGNPPQEYLKLVDNLKIENRVQFLNFMPKNQIMKYMIASDIFVLPTREDIWGLVINEALACGLPVITTDKCISGLEISKICNSIQIIQSENVKMLSESINSMYSMISVSNNFLDSSLNAAKKYTIETMVHDHLKYWNF